MSAVVSIPAGVVHRSVRTEEFQISFPEPFRIVFLGTLLILEALCLSAGVRDEWWLLVGVVPLLTCLLSAVSIGIIVWRYKFSVGPDEIACYDFWCQPLTTPWVEMGAVRRVWLPGLTYARINTRDRFRALWLPLFVADPERLRDMIHLHAGPQHPLTQLLDREVGADRR